MEVGEEGEKVFLPREVGMGYKAVTVSWLGFFHAQSTSTVINGFCFVFYRGDGTKLHSRIIIILYYS